MARVRGGGAGDGSAWGRAVRTDAGRPDRDHSQDGSPRISPVEPLIVQGDLLLGMLWRSKKALDLLREPRCVLHSAISDINGSEGEFKLRGRALEVQPADLRECYRQAFYSRWRSRIPEVFHIFSMDIQSAGFVGWDVENGEMIVKKWSLERGLQETKRKYP